MSLSASLKYQLSEYKKGIIIFYGVVVLILILMIVSLFLPSPIIRLKGRFSGLEMAGFFFLFASGLNSFKEPFRLFLQNSISRKTLLKGRLLTVLIISSGMALIDNIISAICRTIFLSVNGSVSFQSFFEMMYASRYQAQSGGLLMFVEGFLFTLCLYLAAGMVGYFITILYYRMNKAAKITVSVGVPAGLFILLPIIDGVLLNGSINTMFLKFILFAFGFSNGANPYTGMISLILASAFFSGLCWLLMRKAVVKD